MFTYTGWISDMKFNENHRRRYINNIVVTQATLKLYSMTGPIPFVIIGPGCSVPV